MTEKQKTAYDKQIKAFEKQYTAAVKSLTAHPNKEVPVKVGDKSFKVTAGQVASRLIGAEVSAHPGESGPGAANSPSNSSIELNDGILGRAGPMAGGLSHFQEMGITHEGIHWTGWGPMPDGSRSAYGEQSAFGPGEMGGKILGDQHQGPYNAASDELLQP